jgi:hypothetical protein
LVESDLDTRSADQIANAAARCTDRLVAEGMPREEAWRVVAIEINNALQKIEMTVAEMRRLTEQQ